jgi:endonuclease/exonuclease/phosphatase family metal-dependent hydrolase
MIATDAACAKSALSDGDLICVSWNVHRGKGRDGRIDPGRIRAVIAADIAPLAPDILVLQEADADCPPHAAVLDFDAIAGDLGLVSLHGDATLRWGTESHGFLGVIVLHRRDIACTAATLLDLPGHCHRGAVVADLRPQAGAGLRLVATHLSLAQWLRAVQMRTIGQHLTRRDAIGPAMPAVLVGDLNEWRPWGGLALSRGVVGRRLHGPARPTFPAVRPLLPLDRALGDRPGLVAATRVLDSAGIRAASDHRPLCITLRPGQAAGAGDACRTA